MQFLLSSKQLHTSGRAGGSGSGGVQIHRRGGAPVSAVRRGPFVLHPKVRKGLLVGRDGPAGSVLHLLVVVLPLPGLELDLVLLVHAGAGSPLIGQHNGMVGRCLRLLWNW